MRAGGGAALRRDGALKPGWRDAFREPHGLRPLLVILGLDPRIHQQAIFSTRSERLALGSSVEPEDVEGVGWAET
ncbi:hypothetical protein ATC00_16995 [Sinorhizobium americanum]|nr:hypothetical protein ATC00_16995 [Sinorhizobium americanum]